MKIEELSDFSTFFSSPNTDSFFCLAWAERTCFVLDEMISMQPVKQRANNRKVRLMWMRRWSRRTIALHDKNKTMPSDVEESRLPTTIVRLRRSLLHFQKLSRILSPNMYTTSIDSRYENWKGAASIREQNEFCLEFWSNPDWKVKKFRVKKKMRTGIFSKTKNHWQTWKSRRAASKRQRPFFFWCLRIMGLRSMPTSTWILQQWTTSHTFCKDCSVSSWFFHTRNPLSSFILLWSCIQCRFICAKSASNVVFYHSSKCAVIRDVFSYVWTADNAWDCVIEKRNAFHVIIMNRLTGMSDKLHPGLTFPPTKKDLSRLYSLLIAQVRVLSRQVNARYIFLALTSAYVTLTFIATLPPGKISPSSASREGFSSSDLSSLVAGLPSGETCLNRTGFRRWYLTNVTLRQSLTFQSAAASACHVWPEQLPRSDRIEQQLMLRPKRKPTQTKLILLYFEERAKTRLPIGQGYFVKNKCPVSGCKVTYDQTKAQEADAILFKDWIPPTLLDDTVQPSVLALLETPKHPMVQWCRQWFSIRLFHERSEDTM